MHAEPVEYRLRFYSEGRSYSKRDPYDSLATLYVFEDIAVLSGMKGITNPFQLIRLLYWLKERGIEELISFRKGKRKSWNVSKYLDYAERRYDLKNSINSL